MTHDTEQYQADVSSTLGYRIDGPQWQSELFARAEPVLSIANPKKLGYVGSLPGARPPSDNWLTPPWLLAHVYEILDGIELDPCSSPVANTLVKAKRFFALDDSAFLKPWTARSVFLNPPYSSQVIARVIGRLLTEYREGRVQSAIVLTNVNNVIQKTHHTC